jgi:ABC-2 type transport system permease protein
MSGSPSGGAYHRGRGAAHELWALVAIAQRDVIKLLRDRARLAVSLAFPIILIAGLGSVLQSTVGRVTGLDAVTLAFTGVLAATLFQSVAAGMISIAEDRENDFSRELFVTPVSRLTLLGGKVAGESLVALCQGGCVVVFARCSGYGCRWDSWSACSRWVSRAACWAGRSGWLRSLPYRISERRCKSFSS